MRSKSLPFPQKYWFKNENPILNCVNDQANQVDSARGEINGNALLRKVISSLKACDINWNNFDQLITMEDWISKMEGSCDFYIYSKRENFLIYEKILFNLLGQYFDRKIVLIQPWAQNFEFNETAKNSFYLLVLFSERASNNNVYLSLTLR